MHDAHRVNFGRQCVYYWSLAAVSRLTSEHTFDDAREM